MAIQVTNVRCPGAGCNGKKLAEAVGITVGEIRIKCPRCKRVQVIAVNTTKEQSQSGS